MSTIPVNPGPDVPDPPKPRVVRRLRGIAKPLDRKLLDLSAKRAKEILEVGVTVIDPRTGQPARDEATGDLVRRQANAAELCAVAKVIAQLHKAAPSYDPKANDRHLHKEIGRRFRNGELRLGGPPPDGAA